MWLFFLWFVHLISWEWDLRKLRELMTRINRTGSLGLFRRPFPSREAHWGHIYGLDKVSHEDVRPDTSVSMALLENFSTKSIASVQWFICTAVINQLNCQFNCFELYELNRPQILVNVRSMIIDKNRLIILLFATAVCVQIICNFESPNLWNLNTKNFTNLMSQFFLSELNGHLG